MLTSHAPLVGQYSYAGHVTGKATYSLGPMLYWLLALPAHYGSAASITWTMATVNTLAIIGVVALARRRGGLVLMFAAAVAVALMCQSIAAETLHDIWNPAAGVLPFTLLIFLCWSLACGEYRLFALTVLVASFVVQAHLMYLAPTLALLAVGVGGLVVSRRWPPGRTRGPASTAAEDEVAEVSRTDTPAGTGSAGQPAPAGRAGSRPVWPWVVGALAVAVLCWSAPVINQVTESPGNMTSVVQSATSSETTFGIGVGWHAVVRAVGVRPWWLYTPVDRWQRKYDIRASPRAHTVISCILLLAALLVTMVVGLARGRRDVAAAGLIGLLLCGSLAAVAASTPTPPRLAVSLGYTMWLGSPIGMWVWLIGAWSAWLGLGSALRRRSLQQPVGSHASLHTGGARRLGAPGFASSPAPVLAWTAGLIATVTVAGAVAAGEKPDEHVALYRPVASLASSLDRTIPSGRSVELLANLGYSTTIIKPSIRYFLARHGVRAMGRGSRARIGDWYELYNRPFEYVVYVEDGVEPPARGASVIDRVVIVDGQGHHVVSLWVAPHAATRAARRR